MEQTKFITRIQRVLKLIDETEEADKCSGLSKLEEILVEGDDRLVKLGYRLVFLKELIKLVTFEPPAVLDDTLKILQDHYFSRREHWDELAETLVYRVARSNELEVCRMCLSSLLRLVDHFDEQIAKHSKQILKLADINSMSELNPLLSEILLMMKEKLPERRES